MTNNRQAPQMGQRRPKRSAERPAPTAPTKAPPLVKEVTISCSFEVRTCPRDELIVTRTAEMYPVS